MRRVDLLISQCRRATENVESSESTGIDDEEFIQYLNDAQDQLQSLIQVSFPNVFQNEEILSAAADQEEYDIPSDAFLGNRVDLIEYSPTSSSSDYYPLDLGYNRERLSGVSATPSYYIRRSKKFLLVPAPQQSGLIRVLYQKSLARIDKRRALVSAVTLTGSAITSLTVDTTEQIDDEELVQENYISVVDKYGNIKMRRIPVTLVDTASGAVTIDPGFTFAAGETIAVGNYLLRGYEATTHSQLPDICERYLVEYCNMRIAMRDSSTDANDTGQVVRAIAEDILASFRQPDGGVSGIAILDGQYLTPEDD
jgi:hypothetical protein